MSRDVAYLDLEDLDEFNDVPFDEEEPFEEPCPGCGSTIDCEADCPELAHRCAELAEVERREAGLPACEGCGCTAVRACPGGCVWATERLCSRCVIEEVSDAV